MASLKELFSSLENKVAIVTGARRGIGKGIALALGEAGANVVVSDSVIEDGALEAVAAKGREIGRNFLFLRADVTKRQNIEDLISATLDRFGRVDILVNNAGRNIAVPLVDMREEGWDKVIDTNLKGYHMCSQAAAKVMMKQRSGTIINIASVWANRAVDKQGAYCISKAGVVMLTKVMALELAAYNIRVNAVAPGVVKTDFSRSAWDTQDSMSRLLQQIPLGRLAEPEEIAWPVLFLASQLSQYMTGHTLTVDGGWMSL